MPGTLLAAGLMVAGCTRFIEWDEEVLLNTGEIIWVHRAGSYSNQSQPGNPLVYRYWPDSETRIAFTYKGQAYSYTTDGEVQLIAIAPDGRPNLVLSAASHPWQWKHNYYCTRPSYVQLRPDSTGTTWSWPAAIDSWLYGLPTNMLYGLPDRDAENSRIRAAEKPRLNVHAYMSGDHFKRVDPTYQTSWCKRRS